MTRTGAGPLLGSAAFRFHRFGTIETVAMRVAFAFVIHRTMLSPLEAVLLTGQPHPTGLAHWFNLTWLSQESIYCWVHLVTLSALIPYVLGCFLPIVLPVLFLGHTLPLTLHNSQGASHHDTNIVSLILLAQCLAYLIGPCCRWLKRPLPFPNGIRLSDVAFRYSQYVVAAVYTISGLQKILRTRGLWPWESSSLAVEIYKTSGQKYHNYVLDEAEHERTVALANWFAENPMLIRFGATGILLLEVFAFLALANRTTAVLFGVLLIAMHQTFAATMGLSFYPNQWCCLIFLINAPFWVAAGVVRLRGSGRNKLGIAPDYPWWKTSS